MNTVFSALRSRSLFAVLVMGAGFAGCVPVLTSPDGGPDSDAPWVAPENSWPMSEVPDSVKGEGWSEGDVVKDARWTDQFGAEVSLWQFYGRVIVLDFSTLWCGPCQVLAADVQATADDYPDDLTYVTILVEDLDGNVPDTEELSYWGEYFGITSPIVSDTANIAPTLLPDSSYPGLFLIDRDLVIHGRIDPASDETIRAEIESAL
jgi:thiol-disulfide isomerase/thioredoxin